MYGVRVADLLYASAESEEEKREASRRFYGRALFVIHSCDVFFGFLLILSSCKPFIIPNFPFM